MKTPVAVTLIIVGGLLILGPAISDHLARAQIVEVMTKQQLTSVHLDPSPLSATERFGCWAIGAVMIAAAVLMSRNPKPPAAG